MGLDVTPVNRNLHTRVTFMLLEFEDLFVVLGIAAVMNVVGRFVSGDIGGFPASVVVQYGVPLSIVPILMAFKYGKPRGYVRDLLFWYIKPRAYCAAVRDEGIKAPYLKEE
jgi:hypothetical protein